MPSSLVYHQHPFASFCQKPLIAFYELGLDFTSHIVTDAASRQELAKLWPMAKIPVLRDEDADLTLGESSVIIEYASRLRPEAAPLIPADPDEALQVRLWDRFFDVFVQVAMQKIVADALRGDDERDPTGVAEARDTLDQAYSALDQQLAGRSWAASETFSMADCAAAPALFYARVVHPWDEAGLPELTRYYAALMHRPSVIRVVDEARPMRGVFPLPWPADVDAHQPPHEIPAG